MVERTTPQHPVIRCFPGGTGEAYRSEAPRPRGLSRAGSSHPTDTAILDAAVENSRRARSSSYFASSSCTVVKESPMTTELDLPLKMTEVHAKEICMWLNQTLSELKKLPPLEQTTKGPFAWGVCEEPPS